MTLFISCILFNFSYCPSYNGIFNTGYAAEQPLTGRSWVHPVPSPFAQFKKGHRQLRTAEQSTTPNDIKDYELDYPQLYSTIETSTSRVPPKFLRYPNRGIVQAKCEERYEGKSFPDPTWCKRYFHCEKGFLNVYICPELTVFNPKRNHCDYITSGQCSLSYLGLNIANWRKVITKFYMTSEPPWVRDRMLKNVVPMSEVTTPTLPPIFTFPSQRYVPQPSDEGTRTKGGTNQ